MEPFIIHRGKVAGLDRVNVDTDQIIPKQFLKSIDRSGFGKFLFYDWRYLSDGSPNPEFELNRKENEGATILVANENFGCGSSREHAPWALLDYGFKVIIAPSFADIFYNNCLKNRILPIRLEKGDIEYLFNEANSSSYECTISLEDERMLDSKGFERIFEIDPYWKEMLIKGWDEIDKTLSYEQKIIQYETRQGGI
ncbi:3-isopropylmalate dehydratase small subunit [Fredinandcohnia quinoae]|uniref:3-isopropylmalate dehydratase small subunit n=1 Tax=Fredinandcohnia quinoae TaxID=2918902 RepID=A0AAW5EEM8_9BACI|nr:3-isopropylmalate dehydratase small subunit [Fredinandcohnia sp. SECRCQ15]MCH1627618.1 3-isopropylmalate dehydratase small subunit [Fredinandcohnia sp. SECRCQ15]